jgi:hypothetical protein
MAVPATMHAENRRVRQVDASLSHHGDQVSISQSVRDVPAHAELNNLGLKPTSAVDLRRVLLLWSSALLHERKLGANTFNAPEPKVTQANQ